jgi:phosphoribulokinase
MYDDIYKLDASLVIPTEHLRMSIMNHIDTLKPIIENAVKEAIEKLETDSQYQERLKVTIRDSVVRTTSDMINKLIDTLCYEYVDSKKDEINKVLNNIIFNKYKY